MKPNKGFLSTKAEVRAAYREGENAVVLLFEQITAAVIQLAEWVQALEDQMAKKKNNTSKPPTSDGY